MKSFILIMLLLLTGCHKSSLTSSEGHVGAGDFFLQRHARIVWLQDRGDQQDVFALGGNLHLMGWDSQTDRVPRSLLPGAGSFSKPLITPDGEHIIYTVRPELKIQALGWDEKTPRSLTQGFALDTWQDPEDQQIWVIAGRQQNDKGVFGEVVRFPIDRPDEVEVLLQKVQVNADTFQLSDDGTVAAGLFPWPAAGIVHLEDERVERLAKGCWTAMSPGASPIMWTFDGSHRNLELQDLANGQRWQVPLSDAPRIGGHEVYHPRWSTHPRFMVMTGPYLHRKGGNNIRGGGEAVEIMVGRFSPDFRAMEAWKQVTSNSRADFFPDLWVKQIEGDTLVRLESSVKATPPPNVQTDTPDVLEVKLLQRTPFPRPEDIAPYTRALVAHEYQVLSPGDWPHDRILIARWGLIEDSEVVPRTTESTYTLSVVPYKEAEELEGERLLIETEDPLLPLFFEKEMEMD